METLEIPERLLTALRLMQRGKLSEARMRMRVDTTIARAAPENDEQQLEHLVHHCLRRGMFELLEEMQIKRGEARGEVAELRVAGDGDERLMDDLRRILDQMKQRRSSRSVVLPQTWQELVTVLLRRAVAAWKDNENKGGALKRKNARLKPGTLQPRSEILTVKLDAELAQQVRAAAIAEGVSYGQWVKRACGLEVA